MRTLIYDFLSQVGPGYVTLFSAHRAIKFTYLTSYVCQFVAFRLEPTLTVWTIEPIHLLNSHIYNLHYITLFLG